MVSRNVAPHWSPLESIQPWKKLSFPHLQDLLRAKAEGVLQAQGLQPEEKLNTGCLPHQMRQEMRSTAGQIQHALSSVGSTGTVVCCLGHEKPGHAHRVCRARVATARHLWWLLRSWGKYWESAASNAHGTCAASCRRCARGCCLQSRHTHSSPHGLAAHCGSPPRMPGQPAGCGSVSSR